MQGLLKGWLKVLLWVVFWIAILGTLAYIGYRVYKKETKHGSCKFVSSTPPDTSEFVLVSDSDDYTQVGYIDCEGGGDLWVQKTLKITNIGPGTFYVEYQQDGGKKHEIIVNDTLTLKITKGPQPNVFVVTGAKTIIPTFKLETS